MYSRVPECQITTYYYVGFAYLMMRRYQDAIRVFANILLYIQRTRNMFQRTTYKYEMVSAFCFCSIGCFALLYAALKKGLFIFFYCKMLKLLYYCKKDHADLHTKCKKKK